MKKLILLLALFLALAMGAYAGDLVGNGEGNTLDEAKANALDSLKDKVFLKLYSSRLLCETDDGSSHSQSYEKTVRMESDVGLYGVDYKNTQLNDGTWKVTARICKDRQGIYANEIQKLSVSLNDTDWEKRGDWNDFGPYYMKKIEARDKFDVCSLILLLLNDKAVIPEVPPRSEFEAALDRAMGSSDSSLEMEIKLGESKQKRGKMTEDEEAGLEKRKAEHAKIQQERQEWEKRKEKESRAYAQKREDEDLQYLKNLDALIERKGQTGKKAGGEASAIGLVAQIEGWREFYDETRSKLAKELNDCYESFSREADRKAKEIYCRSYYPVQLDPTGMPQVVNLEARVNEADQEVYKIYEESYHFALGQYTVYDKSLSCISKEAERLLDDLPSRRFSISSQDGSVSTQIKGADLRNGEWKGKAYFFLGAATIDLDFTIPYTTWTGKKVASNADPKSWESYVANFDRWDTRFMNPNAYNVEIVYHLKGSLNSNDYVLYVDKLAVSDPMEGGRTVWSRSKDSERCTLRIGGLTCDMTNHYVPNQFYINGPGRDIAAEVESKLAMEAAMTKASTPASSEAPIQKSQPKPETIVKKKIKRDEASNLLISFDFAVSKKIEGSGASIISVGMRKISPKPLFADTRVAFDAGLGVLSPDSFFRPAGLQGAAEVGLMLVSFLDSYSYIDWGLNLGLEVDPVNLAASSARPSFRIGYGDEGDGFGDPGSVRFWLQAGLDMPFDKSDPKPVAGVGMTVGLFAR